MGRIGEEKVSREASTRFGGAGTNRRDVIRAERITNREMDSRKTRERGPTKARMRTEARISGSLLAGESQRGPHRHMKIKLRGDDSALHSSVRPEKERTGRETLAQVERIHRLQTQEGAASDAGGGEKGLPGDSKILGGNKSMEGRLKGPFCRIGTQGKLDFHGRSGPRRSTELASRKTRVCLKSGGR